MAFADHEFDKSDPGITNVIDVADPINGNGALRVDNAGNEAAPAINILNERLNTNFQRGLIDGKIRTRFHISDHELAVTREGEYGIYCMASQLDLTLGAGAAYAFVLHVDTDFDWRLVEYASGISIGGGRIDHASGSTVGAPALDKNMVMELDWVLDLDNIGGIRLTCRAAAGTDFSLLETVYTVTLGSPLLTSVSEGLLYGDLEGASALDLKRIYFQDTFYANFVTKVIA